MNRYYKPTLTIRREIFEFKCHILMRILHSNINIAIITTNLKVNHVPFLGYISVHDNLKHLGSGLITKFILHVKKLITTARFLK